MSAATTKQQQQQQSKTLSFRYAYAPTTPTSTTTNKTISNASATTALRQQQHVQSQSQSEPLPQGRVLDVMHAMDRGTQTTTIKVLLNTGAEKTINDSGTAPIRISRDLSIGDTVEMKQTGPQAWTWSKTEVQTRTTSNTTTTTQRPTATTTSKQTKTVKPRHRLRPFSVDDLVGVDGISRCVSLLPLVSLKGNGHEREDVHNLVYAYKLWAANLYPAANFRVLIKRIEVMGTTKRVHTDIERLRHIHDTRGEGGGYTDNRETTTHTTKKQKQQHMQRETEAETETQATQTQAQTVTNTVSVDIEHKYDEEDNTQQHDTLHSQQPQTVNEYDYEEERRALGLSAGNDQEEAPLYVRAEEGHQEQGAEQAQQSLADMGSDT